MRLLYFAPADEGGLADYAHFQANALADACVNVEMLTSESRISRDCRYAVKPILSNPRVAASRLATRMSFVRCVGRNGSILASEIRSRHYDRVLFGSYSEYLSPLWARPLRRLAREGVVFGSVVHDPVRDYVVGPIWWHRYSVRCAYSFLREAFVHDAIALDTIRPMEKLRTTVIPHGPYIFPASTHSRTQVRKNLGIPEDAPLLLSFGHIRDGKNLDLVLHALSRVGTVYLLVAGREQSSRQKPLAYYQSLARSLGVEGRCRWLHRYIPDGEIGDLFSAADFSLLTYSKAFRSASGVLNTAVNYRKPCLASGGEGNLKSMVRDYNLGIWTEPDDLESVVHGLDLLLNAKLAPRWEDYEAANSWKKNAEIVAAQLK